MSLSVKTEQSGRVRSLWPVEGMIDKSEEYREHPFGTHPGTQGLRKMWLSPLARRCFPL